MELGRYRLDEQVGQGGMAVVWRGWDTQLRRTVAVKVLHAHLNSREDIRKRFGREAQAVARLHHPHILDVYDFSGPSAEPSYLVTEFIRGMTLRQFAEKHPFDPPELAAACLLPIAEALVHAHAAGVVHRDLKPENVMVREDGVVKLTDFGIAALLEPDEKFTVTGSILGSPAHLAPETIEGKPADPRSDLFSFGTILYWLSSGQLPFQGNSPAALLRNILQGKPQDPRALRHSVSDAQAKVIARCLETDPAKRYQSAKEVHHDLLQLLKDAGMNEPLQDLAAFVKEPEPTAARVRKQLVERSLLIGDDQLLRGKTTAALASFGRVLTLDPQNSLAREKVDRIRRRERLLFLGRRALLGLGMVLLIALGGWQIDQWMIRSQERQAAESERQALQMVRENTKRRIASQKPQQQPVQQQTPPVQQQTQQQQQQQQPPPIAKPQPRPPSQPQQKPPQVAQAQQQALLVKLHARFGAQVTVDGHDEGNNNMFSLKLAPGAHRVLVHHPCCADAEQEIQVTPSKPDQLYQLRYGAPLPAQFKVVGAPPDSRILIDGVLIGTATDPRPYTMGAPDQRVTVTIGDRTLGATLKAGMINTLDYAQAAP